MQLGRILLQRWGALTPATREGGADVDPVEVLEAGRPYPKESKVIVGELLERGSRLGP